MASVNRLQCSIGNLNFSNPHDISSPNLRNDVAISSMNREVVTARKKMWVSEEQLVVIEKLIWKVAQMS